VSTEATQSPALLERTGELKALGEAIAQAEDGAGGALVVLGPAGIGKSSLLGAAGEMARERGLRVLSARGVESERAFAFGGARQLLEPVIARASDEERSTLFAGPAAHAQNVIGHYEAPAGAPSSTDAEFATFHSLYWLTMHLAEEGPLAVVADDLQWLDPASLRFLEFLAARLSGLPLALLAAARLSSEAPIPSGLAPLLSGTLIPVSRPRILSPQALGELIERWMGEPEEPFTAALAGATGGNPLFATELARSMAVQGVAPTEGEVGRVAALGGTALGPWLLTRTAGLSEEASRLARSASLFGHDASLGEVAEVSGLSLETASEAASELAGAGILAARDPLEFVHPVIREALASQLDAYERAVLHAEIAAVLRARRASPDAVASHLVDAEPGAEDWVVEELHAAAERAIANGAPEAAVAYLRRALSEGAPGREDGRLLAALGAAEAMVGDLQAPDHLRQAIELSGEDAGARVGASLVLGRMLYFALAQVPEAISALKQAEMALSPSEEELGRLLDGELLMLVHFAQREEAPGARELFERKAKQLGEIDTPGKRLIAATLAFDEALQGERGVAISLATESFADGKLIEEVGPESPHVYLAAIALVYCRDAETATAALKRADKAAVRSGSRTAYQYVTSVRAFLAVRCGHVLEAEEVARESVQAAIDSIPTAMPFPLGCLIESLCMQGKAEEALEEVQALEASGALAAALLPTPHTMVFLGYRARLYLALNRPADALADLELAEFLWLSSNLASRGELPVSDVINWCTDHALTLAALGNETEAAEMAAEELRRSQDAPERVVGLGIAQRTAALLGPDEERLSGLETSASTLEGTSGELEYAVSLLELGAALRRGGSRKEARERLNAAAKITTRLGAKRITDRIGEELAASGAKLSRKDTAAYHELTASERRVAALAAEGMTNREIAQSLFLTVKTIETHLSHAFAKLDISSRRELGKVLG
jgi:DNA-binding CsgD family transcriptional regulator